MVRLRFDRDAKFSVAAAFDAAAELRHNFHGTEHLLLGLAATVPELFPVEPSLDDLKHRIAALAGPSPTVERVKHYTDQAKRALRAAEESALRRGSPVVTAKDLLEALRAADGAVVTMLLDEVGIQPARTDSHATSFRDALSPLDFIRVRDDSEAPYYDQIQACIKEAVASGQLIPGDRLPPVRQLGDLLEIAPGTVARAYKELESDGIVITAGTHGTVVAARDAAHDSDAEDRIRELVGLLRPVTVSAFHMGSDVEELSEALRIAVHGVFGEPSNP
jgi:GntR family transcriptional regulator